MPIIDIPDEELKDLLGERLLSALSEDTRNALIKAALNHLMTGKDSYSRKTPLQEAFDMALTRLAHKLADEVIEQSSVKDNIKEELGKLVEAIPEVLADDEVRGKIYDSIFEKARKLYRAAQ